ncbi:hypothetical protein AB1N83_013160 [Pleurotus pulmonarius]
MPSYRTTSRRPRSCPISQASRRTVMDTIPSFELYAPYFAGLTLTLTLYGVTLAQSLLYFRAYQGDKFYLKTVVISLVGLQSTQVVFTLISVLELKPRFGHAIMDVVPRSFIKSEFPIFISTSVVQLAYTHRVWFLSNKQKTLVSVIVSDVVAVGWYRDLERNNPKHSRRSSFLSSNSRVDWVECTSNILLVDQFNLEAFIFMPRNVKLRIIQLCSSATCDLLITCSLVYLLRGQYQQVLSSTRNMIDAIIVISIGVGLITSLFCILTIIMWFASKDNLWLPFQLLSASFYTNSFLASLNSRSMVRQRGFSDGVNTSAELALTDLRKI